MQKLLIATGNPGKLKEIQTLLDELPAEWHQKVATLLPRDLDLYMEVEENGCTYAENAAIKAKAFCKASGLITLADDSGLELDALNGNPGLHSARFSPKENATDADRREHLLFHLKDKPRPWKALFRCTVAVAIPCGTVHYSTGECVGEIIPEERGEHGFGYDPIFLLPERGLTTAELTEYEKNLISHRALAVRAALPILQKIF
ncbi:MAG: RdgB/HAM1 family non-canonical purine NTP pyrophosphatase [Anaerolineaceae bacterium]|nr:RdgB/HAM1 family non-canonical purine NTP pyrophosphatase [Anaerolineaceae bacterium]